MGGRQNLGRRGRRALDIAAILAGAASLLWPAIANRYPIVFSDTAAFIEQAMGPDGPWDKPFAYGPWMLATGWGVSLWGVVAAQAALLSWLLYVTLTPTLSRKRERGPSVPPPPLPLAREGRGEGEPHALLHLALCATLALLTPAPWFVSLVMPDIFAAIPILCAYAILRRAAPYPPLVAAMIVACAVHLTHLIIAASAVAILILAWQPRAALKTALPIAVAALLLIASNAALYGKPGISPYGSVFLLARLVADGPAHDELRTTCPEAGYHLCTWVTPTDRLPTDSDDFLWNGDGPDWELDGGPTALAPEASRINLATVLHRPLAVVSAMALNTARQAILLDIGDATGPEYLTITVGFRLLQHYPWQELTRFQGGRQIWDRLNPLAAPFLWVHRIASVLAFAGTLAALARRRTRLLAALVLVGVLANAFATGALSGPHPRYQSRIAWLLAIPCAALLVARPHPAGYISRL